MLKLLNLLRPFKKKIITGLIIILFLPHNYLYADSTINITNDNLPLSIGNSCFFYNDLKNQYDYQNILSQKFLINNNKVPVYALPIKGLWVKFRVKNVSNYNHLLLSIGDPNISNIWLYRKDEQGLTLLKHTGAATDFNTRETKNTSFDFDLILPRNVEQEFYIKLNGPPAELPLTINNLDSVNANTFAQTLIIGLYCGVIISVLLYNLFLFFATKDKSYLIYVIYIFVLGFAQVTLAGWSFRFFWPANPSINSYIVIATSCFAGTMAILFAKSFLNTANYTPKLNRLLSFLSYGYLAGVILSFTSFAWISYLIFNFFGLTLSITLVYTSVIIYRKGFRPAYFYLVSWSIFLSCLVIYLLKNLNLIPTNNFTHFILYYAAAAEAIFFSIALADRINILKKEKELSQAQALQASQENERLVKEQNVILENKVEQRTHELKESNNQLSVALDNLKDAQTQLVDAEKMASLGQLTAGIAHEINNPINFVKSNINPLRLDVRDLLDILNEYDDLHKLHDEPTYRKKLSDIEKFKKQIDVDFVQKEINSLIVGIEEGAERTAEIVQGLRTFSRIDEAEIKTVDVHDGILSTLVILKNSTPYFVKIEKEFHAKGNVECYPGKLNQVFMNILTNAIQAITAKPEKSTNEAITISTKDVENDCIQISIKDTGMGMTEDVKHRIFEPFFTTKEVGEGTGLGMAIVFKIIQKHEGKIDIKSKPLEGSEFIITLPYKHPISDHL